jgi:hypothetical protein
MCGECVGDPPLARSWVAVAQQRESSGNPRKVQRTIPDCPEQPTTFHGATVIGHREPGGHLITFAQFADSQA